MWSSLLMVCAGSPPHSIWLPPSMKLKDMTIKAPYRRGRLAHESVRYYAASRWPDVDGEAAFIDIVQGRALCAFRVPDGSDLEGLEQCPVQDVLMTSLAPFVEALLRYRQRWH